jgi:hypothetical protein
MRLALLWHVARLHEALQRIAGKLAPASNDNPAQAAPHHPIIDSLALHSKQMRRLVDSVKLLAILQMHGHPPLCCDARRAAYTIVEAQRAQALEASREQPALDPRTVLIALQVLIEAGRIAEAKAMRQAFKAGQL